MRSVFKTKGKSFVSFILSLVMIASALSIMGAPAKAYAADPFVKSSANTCLGTKNLSSDKSKELTDSLSVNDNVLFTSKVTGTKWDDAGATFKLTIESGHIGIDCESATVKEKKATVSYKLSGRDKAKINAVSLLITDMDPEKTKASIKVYDRLDVAKDKNDSAKLSDSGKISFDLPSDYDDETDCVYLLAETIDSDNGKNDYAAMSLQLSFFNENENGTEGGEESVPYIPSTGFSSHLEYSSGVTSRASLATATNLGALFELEYLKESASDPLTLVSLEMSFKPVSIDPFLKLYLYRYRRSAGRANYRTEFIDISIDKTVGSNDVSKTVSQKSSLSSTDEVIESAITFNTKVSDMLILREHNGRTTRFVRLRRRPAAADFRDGTFYLNVKEKTLYIYSNKFSTFALDYSIDKNASEDETVNLSVGAQGSPDQSYKNRTVSVFRMYNPVTKQHFFTVNTSEKDSLLKSGWVNEGIAFNVPALSDSPVYRLLNVRTGEHYYTANASEKNALIAKGWSYENIAWYNDEAKTHKVYRLTLKNRPGVSHYTSSGTERDLLVRSGWISEDTGLFVK